MSSRYPITPHKVIDAGSMTGTSVLTSKVTIIQQTPLVSYSVIWTGTPTGTFSVEVSNDYKQNPDGSVQNAGTWTTLPSTVFVGTYPAPSGSADNGILEVDLIGAYAIRLQYTNVSGVGTLNAYICGKNT